MPPGGKVFYFFDLHDRGDGLVVLVGEIIILLIMVHCKKDVHENPRDFYMATLYTQSCPDFSRVSLPCLVRAER